MSRKRAKAAVPATVAVVLPVDAVPGLQRLGAYVPGTVYHVAPDIAERLRARGFQLAPVGAHTALPPPAESAGRGTPTPED